MPDYSDLGAEPVPKGNPYADLGAITPEQHYGEITKTPGYNPIEHAASDPSAKEAAFEVYKQQQRQPVTAGDVGRGALQFAKGAIPTYDQNGNWSWPLASGVKQLVGGIYNTAKNIHETAGKEGSATQLMAPLTGAFVPAAINALTEDPTAERAGRQLGVGVEEGALDAARMSAHARQNISGAAGHLTGNLIGTQAKDLSDADLRKRFDDEVEAHHLQQQFQQGRYASLLPSGGGEAEGGEPIGMSPEQLAAKGAPIKPEEIQGIASTTNPANFAELGAITNPIAKSVMAPIVSAAGRAIEPAIGAAQTAYNITKAFKNPLGSLRKLVTGLATGAEEVAPETTGNILTESGAEMAGAAPQVGQSALRKITKEGIKGAAGAVPTGSAFATTGTTPEEAGNQFWGAVGLGGALSGLSAVPKSGKAGAIEQSAVAGQLAREGAAANFGMGYDAWHQEAMRKLDPQEADLLNKFRGFNARLRTVDGKPVQVYGVTADKFAEAQKRFGEVDANGNATNPNGRGMISPDGSQLFINVDAGNIGEPLGHETGHAAELAAQFTNAVLAESLKANIAKGLFTPDANGHPVATPDFQKFVDAYSKAVGPDKAAKMHQDGTFESEYVAETARKLLDGGNVEKFALPKSMVEGVSDWLQDNLGMAPKPGKLGFDGTEVQAITRNVRDLLRSAGTAPATDTSAQYRIEQIQNTLKQPLARNATVADLNSRDAARKELDTLQKQMNPQGNFPAAGKPPVPPSAPSTDIPRVAAYLRQQGIPAAEAAQWASVAQGKTIDEKVVDALKQRANQKFPSTQTQPPKIEVPQNITFNDENGIAYRVTGATTEAPRTGDTVIDTAGKPYRVSKVWPDGSVDVAYTTSPLNARPSNTLRPGSFQRVNTEPHVPQTPPIPSEQVPAGTETPNEVSPTATQTNAPAEGTQTPGGTVGTTTAPKLTVKPFAGGRFVIVDEAGNPINSKTYASEVSAQAAIRLQGKGINLAQGPGGSPDILNHIAEMGGIAPKKATQEYDDMPAVHKGYSQLLGGTESPEDIARDLHREHNIGDGSVSMMWQLVQDAMNTRRTTTTKTGPTDAAQERQGKAQAEEHVQKLVSDAETTAAAAEKKPDTKAAKERIQRAKIDAIVNDIGDDPTGLHRVTDQFGNTSIVGNYDHADPRHRALAEMGGLSSKDAAKVDDVQSNQGNVRYIRYRSALSNAEGEGGEGTLDTGMKTRQAEYAIDPAETRTEGTIQHKAMIPMSTELNSPSGKLSLKFLTLDNVLHNVASIFEGLKGLGRENPYGATAAEQQPLIVRDSQAYAENHAHGYKGDGSGPMQRFPDSGLPDLDPNYQPQEISKERFDILNMAFHDERAGKLDTLNAKIEKYQSDGKPVPKPLLRQQAAAQELYALAVENNSADENSSETNQLRAEMKAAGFDVSDRLKNPFENLSPQHILETSDKPIPLQPGDIPSVRPTGFDVDPAELGRKGLPNQKAVGAGFMPEDTSKPEEGSNPGERLAREAEQSGIFLTMATMKGLMKQDAPTMEMIRKRIQDKTGKTARFQPAGKSGYTAPPKVQVFNGGGQGAVAQPERKKTPQERARERLALKAA